MKIWLYALCGQEAQMLPYFLKHYEQEVDKIILLDGGMDEATVDAAMYRWNFPSIEETPFTRSGYDEKKFMDWSQEKYKEARKQADWVIWVDVDEFIVADKPLREALTEYRRREIEAVLCQGYQMAAESFPEYDGRQLTDLVKIGAYDKIYNKMCVFNPDLTVRWSVGRHSCAIDGLEPTWTGLKLLHYRYFGDEWLKERNAQNWARRSAEDIETGRGYHCAPDYSGGRYSPEWYKKILNDGKAVI